MGLVDDMLRFYNFYFHFHWELNYLIVKNEVIRKVNKLLLAKILKFILNYIINRFLLPNIYQF